jgi:hypothetical protein
VDILDLIDEAIATGGCCACGCGRDLDPAGPSSFFATQDCQARWHAAQATDPGDVYDRPDPIIVHTRPDDPPQYDETPDTLSPSHDNIHGTAYRVECPHCLRAVAHQPHVDDDDTCDRPSDECRVYISRDTCPRCTAALPDIRYIAAVHDHGPILLFELFDGTSRTHRRMPARRLDRAPDRRHLIDLTWEIMRRDVDRFTRSWTARRTDAVTFPVINDPNALVRITGLG